MGAVFLPEEVTAGKLDRCKASPPDEMRKWERLASAIPRATSVCFLLER